MRKLKIFKLFLPNPIIYLKKKTHSWNNSILPVLGEINVYKCQLLSDGLLSRNDTFTQISKIHGAT